MGSSLSRFSTRKGFGLVEGAIPMACNSSSINGPAESVKGSLGATQFATMDINGVTRDVVALGHKSASGEIRFVLVVVKMGGDD